MPKPRNLYCENCRLHLGEVRDATLRKGLVVLCGGGNTKRQAAEMKIQGKRAEPKDLFGSLFSGLKGDF